MDTLAVASIAASHPLNVAIGAGLGGCLIGALLAALGAACLQRRRRKEASVPTGPPGYLSAKQQNHYVSMGSLDWKKSSSLVVDASLKITNSDHYPTATIKRNSHVGSASRDHHHHHQQQQQQQHCTVM